MLTTALQATLEAEVTSLRGSLEEKDGLIDALREALRSSASGEETGDPGAAVATAVAVEREAVAAEAAAAAAATARDVAEMAPAPASAPAPTQDVLPGRLVVGRGVFARSGGRNRERYRSRTSRLLSASGPVAMAEAETAATAAKAEAAAAAAAAAVTARREAVRLLPRGTEGENTLALGADPEGGVAGGVRIHPRPAGAAAALSLSSSSPLHDRSAAENAGAGLEESLPVAGTLAAGAAASDYGQDGRPAVSGTAVSGQEALPVGGVRENGDDGSGVMYQASAVTGAAFRVLRDSARVVRSRVGLDGAAPSPGKPGRRSASSHAVLIL